MAASQKSIRVLVLALASIDVMPADAANLGWISGVSAAFNFSHVEAIVGVEAVLIAEIAESERTVAIALKMAWSASTSSLLRLL